VSGSTQAAGARRSDAAELDRVGAVMVASVVMGLKDNKKQPKRVTHRIGDHARSARHGSFRKFLAFWRQKVKTPQ
jgi:hypothetical protein